MTESQLLIIEAAKKQVTDLLTNKLSQSIRFHTITHTQEVVAAAEILADQHPISDEDRFALTIAAWFHDTGYTGGVAKDHETVSIQLATEFLQANSVNEEIKNKVIGCINATRMPQDPSTTIERIIADADLFHLGTDAFKEKNRLLREELNDFGGKDVSKKDWRKINIRFLEAHNYFTAYAKEKLEPIKQQHLVELQEKENYKTTPDMKIDKKDKPKEKGKDNDKLEAALKKAADAKAKLEKEKQSERGISTVFRIVAQNQNNLSGMADSKANILISVNSIILSIIISTLSTQLQKNPNLLYPIILLVIVCVSAIVFSILATRPNTNHGTFTQDDIKQKKTNLLFFGNFYKMSLPDYDWAMKEMLADKDYLYASIAKDNYFLGVVLARKYRFLRYAYNIFMFGLVLSMIAFAIAMMIQQPAEAYAG